MHAYDVISPYRVRVFRVFIFRPSSALQLLRSPGSATSVNHGSVSDGARWNMRRDLQVLFSISCPGNTGGSSSLTLSLPFDVAWP
jgi:hypothetical protein